MKLKETETGIADRNGQKFYTLEKDCKGTLKNETLDCPIDWNFRINLENGRITFIIKKEGRDESLDSSNDGSFTITVLKDGKILTEVKDCKLEKSETYKKNCISSLLDWRRFLKDNPSKMSILIKSDSCCCDLGDMEVIENLNDSFPKCIGDKGQGFGTIFYDKGNDSDGWRYLEVGQTIGLYPFGYYKSNSNDKINETIGTRTEKGLGMENTDSLVTAMGEKAYNLEGKKDVLEYAAKACKDYRGGGLNDWFLPSKDELELIYLNLISNKNLVRSYDEYGEEGRFDSLGVPNGYSCWSSSEYSNNDKEIHYSFSQDYAYDNLGGTSKEEERYVLPVRRFK